MELVLASRYHDFSCGHRVHGHEGKCALIHGHNYRAHFDVEAERLDAVGRVLDFSKINTLLCHWLEDNWDHRFLAWDSDVLMWRIKDAARLAASGLTTQSVSETEGIRRDAMEMLNDSIVWVPFNPTAENMALYLLKVVGPKQLAGTGIRLSSVRIDETRKCSASALLGDDE